MIWWLSDEWMSLSIHVTVMFCMQFFTCTRNSQSYYYHQIPGYLSYVTNQNEVNQHCVEFLQFPVHVPTSVCLLQAACVYVQPASSQYTAKHASVQWIPHVNHTSSISSQRLQLALDCKQHDRLNDTPYEYLTMLKTNVVEHVTNKKLSCRRETMRFSCHWIFH